MNELVDQIVAFIREHHAWAGPILALMAFGESLAVLGVLFPCTAVMLLAGGLIGAGTLPALPILAWTIPGAILGDALSFWIGRWLGPGARRHWPLSKAPKTLDRGEHFFRRYGTASIFLGRFFGPVRAAVPLIAGILRMDQRRFQIANIASAIVWVPALLAPGYLTAKEIAKLGSLSETQWVLIIGGGLLLITLGGWLVLWLLRRLGRGRQRDSAASRG